MVMWFSGRKVDVIIQSKGEGDSNVASADGNSIIFEPHHVIARGRLSVSDFKRLQDTLRLHLKGSEFTNAFVFSVKDVGLFGKVNK
jgi:hypothetical protein